MKFHSILVAGVIATAGLGATTVQAASNTRVAASSALGSVRGAAFGR